MPDASNDVGFVVLTTAIDHTAEWDLQWDGELYTELGKAEESAAVAVSRGWRTAVAKVEIVERWAVPADVE